MNKVDLENNTINDKHSYFLEYYNMIFTHGWVAGRYMKMLLEYLLEELEYYDYDQSYAHIRINFMQEYCYQTKNRFNNKPLILMKWEKAYLEVLYSFKHPGSTRRRFTETLLFIARKNGKSTFVAGDMNTDLFIGDGGQDICCASNNDDQASIVFSEVNNMRIKMDPDGHYTHKNRRGILNINSKSRIYKLSEKSRTKEGGNITKASIDEMHEMKDKTLYFAIEQSMSITENPLIFQISSEGFVENGVLDEKVRYGIKLLKKEIEDPTYLPWLYMQDNDQEIFIDDTTWWKSNPSLNVIKQYHAIKKNVEKARKSTEDRAFILCKDFNIKQNNALAWMLKKDVENHDSFKLSDFQGAHYIAGIDISETTDLTAVSIQINKSGKKYFATMYFIPQSKANSENRTNEEKVNYIVLASKGLVIVVPGNEVKTSYITAWLWKLYEDYGIVPFKIGYDQWHAKGMVQDLENKFGDGITEKIGMNYATLSTPMRRLGADLRSNLINYQDNELTLSCLSNVSMKTDNFGRIMPVKVHGSGIRIDGAVSMMICYAVEDRYSSEFEFYDYGGE